MIIEIFLDQDGVLSDFKKRYKEIFKTDAEDDYYTKDKVRKVLHQERFRKFVQSGQFEDLDPMPDLQIGLDYIRSLNIPTCILTSTATEEYIHTLGNQKKNWLKKHNIEYNAMLVPGKRMKCYYAKPNRLLIDDTLSNVEDWRRRFGYAIHHKSWEETIIQMKEFL